MTGSEQVAVYVLAAYQPVANRCEVNATTARLSGQPLIGNNDIISYEPATARFTLQPGAFARIKALNDQTAFAVTVDQKTVYYGFFKPAYSSSSCDHSITMCIFYQGSVITMNLGYPGVVAASQVTDERNSATLLAVLSKQGKTR